MEGERDAEVGDGGATESPDQAAGAAAEQQAPDAAAHAAMPAMHASNQSPSLGAAPADASQSFLGMNNPMLTELAGRLAQQKADLGDLGIFPCNHCPARISHARDASFVQCPNCYNLGCPANPDILYFRCQTCSNLMSYPKHSLAIRCPYCLNISDLQSKNFQIAVEKPMSRRRKKRRRDPCAPKRASNAYMLFCKKNRGKLKEEFPDLHFGKIGAKLGEVWRQMSNSEKEPYEAMAVDDRDRHKDQMRSFLAASATTTRQPGQDEAPVEDNQQLAPEPLPTSAALAPASPAVNPAE